MLTHVSGRKEIEISEEEMPGLMALREKYGVCEKMTLPCTDQYSASTTAERSKSSRVSAYDYPNCYVIVTCALRSTNSID